MVRWSAGILAAALAAGGCAKAVRETEQARARSTVESFLSACAHEQWTAAADVLSLDARGFFVEQPAKPARCAQELGLDPAALPDDPAEAFGSARVVSVAVHGDTAEVGVEAHGATGTAALEDVGQRYRIATR